MATQPSELTARLVDLFGNPATADPTKLYGNLTVNPNGTVQIGTGLVQPDGYTHSLTPMGKNRIINGSIQFVQRGTSASVAAGGLGVVGPDRWYVGNRNSAPGAFTQSQSTLSYNGATRPSLLQTVTTAGGTFTTTMFWYGITQFIEGVNCYDLVGQQVTVSFIFTTNVAGTYSVVLTDGTNANSCAMSFTAASGISYQSVTFPALPSTLGTSNSTSAGLRLCIGAITGPSYQAPAATQGTWVSGNYLTTTTSTNWSTAANNYIGVAEVQLEAGPYPTPFERRPYGWEFLLCQRYYQAGILLYQSAYGAASATWTWTFQYGVPMRVAPAATLGAASYSNGSGLAIANVSATSCTPSFTVTAAGGALVNSSMSLSAEL